MTDRCKHCDAPEGKPCSRWFNAERAMEWDLWVIEEGTNKRRPAVGCFYELVVFYMRSVDHHVMQSQAAVESTRNNISEGFSHVGKSMLMLEQAQRNDFNMIMRNAVPLLLSSGNGPSKDE